jgi:hypothetical protein
VMDGGTLGLDLPGGRPAHGPRAAPRRALGDGTGESRTGDGLLAGGAGGATPTPGGGAGRIAPLGSSRPLAGGCGNRGHLVGDAWSQSNGHRFRRPFRETFSFHNSEDTPVHTGRTVLYVIYWSV